MKIVCDSCGAKYSIADEKVQGKVFKIRCKKCSNVIVVKGNAEAAESSAPDGGGLGGSSDAAEWYVVIDGEQVGPVTPVEIDSYFMSGKIQADTYAWRDGMADWSHVAEIPQFQHLTNDVAGPNEATTIADKPTYENEEDIDATNVMQSPLGGGGSDATVQDSPGAMGYGDDPYPSDPGGGYGDDYGYAAAGADEQGDDEGYSGFGSFDAGGGLGGLGGELAGGGADDDDAGGMFAAFDSGDDGDFMNFGDAGAGDAAAAPANGTNGSNGSHASASAAGAGMVGQRNENSVLFSLSSLDQVEGVTGGGDSSSGGAASAGAASASSGGAVTEGSGLIDIQALASAHKSMNAGGDGSGDGGIDPFQQGTMAMPALMPMGSHRSNKGLIAAAVAGGVLLLGLVGLVGYLLLSKDDKPQEPKVVEKIVVKEKMVNSPEDKEKQAAEEEAAKEAVLKAKEGEPVKAEAEGDEESAEEEDSKDSKKTTRKRRPRRKAVASKSNDDKKDEPAPKPSRRKKDGIDSILGQIDKKAKAQEKKSSSSSSSSSKSKLSKSDVKNTIARYRGRINTCAKSHNSAGKKGTVKVKFYIRPNGRVRGASVVSSGFKGTDVGGCVRKVVGSMKFPSTSASKDVPVTYPFILR